MYLRDLNAIDACEVVFRGRTKDPVAESAASLRKDLCSVNDHTQIRKNFLSPLVPVWKFLPARAPEGRHNSRFSAPIDGPPPIFVRFSAMACEVLYPAPSGLLCTAWTRRHP